MMKYFIGGRSFNVALRSFEQTSPQPIRTKNNATLCFGGAAASSSLTLNLMRSPVKPLPLSISSGSETARLICDCRPQALSEIIPLNSSRRSAMASALLCSLLEINSSPLAVSQTALKRRRCPKETRRSSIPSSAPRTNPPNYLSVVRSWKENCC